MLCELDLAVERWYTLSPLYAFTSLVSLTVTSCVSCFLHSTVVVRTMIAVKSLHHPTNHCLSHPSLLPPRNPGTELIPASDYNRPLVPSLVHYTSCPFKPGLSIDVLIIILPTTWSYPLFSTLLGQAFGTELQLPFPARSVPVFGYLCPNRCFSARLWACWLGLLLFL